MAKLNRESKLRDKRADKQQRKALRRSEAAADMVQPAIPAEDLDMAVEALDETGAV